MASIKQDSNPTSLDIPIHHKINMRNIVMRQTDYSESVADEKLELYKYDVMAVVREFMNPNKVVNEDNDTIVESVNQQIYGEIRGMMDTASWRYRKNKEEEEKKQLMRDEYIRQRDIAKQNLVSKVNTKIEE
jgi:hypothetical protein|tara:strand:+ start:556 stop:951 length:396 start_codon:yes stop_codon:yes gene_type:complete